jgi:hypothetical protein
LHHSRLFLSRTHAGQLLTGTERRTLSHTADISQLLGRSHLLLSELGLGVHAHTTSLEAHLRKTLTTSSFQLSLLAGSTRAKSLGLPRDIHLCLCALRASSRFKRSSLIA